MSAVWKSVYTASQSISPEGNPRIANLAVAAANHHANSKKRSAKWNGRTIKHKIKELALEPLPPVTDDALAWKRLAKLAYDAAHLGNSAEGMYSWAAAYQRASATQKQLGAYATHHAFARAIVRIALDPLEDRKSLRIVDPSVGAGNLLIAAIEKFAKGKSDKSIRRFILNLYGVEIDPRARELCCLLVWLAGARCGVKIDQVAQNIRVANALIMNWWTDQQLFDVLLINPPWESLRHKMVNEEGWERAATRKRLSELEPGAKGLPRLYSAQGQGDRNLFKAFVELVPHLLVEGGRLGGIASCSIRI